MIKPTTYNDKPLPTHDYISWCRKKYKISSKKALNRRVKYGDEYNELYFEKLKPAIEDWHKYFLKEFLAEFTMTTV